MESREEDVEKIQGISVPGSQVLEDKSFGNKKHEKLTS